jgi:hypothetical protein
MKATHIGAGTAGGIVLSLVPPYEALRTPVENVTEGL